MKCVLLERVIASQKVHVTKLNDHVFEDLMGHDKVSYVGGSRYTVTFPNY